MGKCQSPLTQMPDRRLGSASVFVVYVIPFFFAGMCVCMYIAATVAKKLLIELEISPLTPYCVFCCFLKFFVFSEKKDLRWIKNQQFFSDFRGIQLKFSTVGPYY